jgi:hypothetical protein
MVEEVLLHDLALFVAVCDCAEINVKALARAESRFYQASSSDLSWYQ